MSLCLRQKALLELHSVSRQLCVYVLSKPLVHSLSVCAALTQSTHWCTCCHFQPSRLLPIFNFNNFFGLYVYFSLTFCLLYTVVCSVPLTLWLSFFPSFSGPRHYAKLPEKGLLAMPVCASIALSIHFRSFPFFSVTCSHNRFSFRHAENHSTLHEGFKSIGSVISGCILYLFHCCHFSFRIFLPH